MKNQAQIKAFGIHLRRLREAANLSQESLANLAGLSKKTIQRMENAETVASLDSLISLADGLDVSLKKLIDF